MELLKKITFNIFRFLFCLFVTGDIFFTHFVFAGNAYSFQMKIYMIILIILAIANWVILFSRLKVEIKLILVAVTILFNHSVNFFPEVKYAFDYDTCLDMNYCAEGLEINTNQGKMKINKENCLKHGYKWNDKKKYCIINNGAEFSND